MQDKFEEFKKLLVTSPEKPKEIYSRVIDNQVHTQKKIIQYRKLIVVYAVFYYLAVLDHLNLVFINQYLKISADNTFLSLDSVERLMVIVAPMFFSIVYYLLLLAKFHRGLITVYINKYNNSESISFFLTQSFSAGLVRGFFSRLKNKNTKHKFNKYFELSFYMFTVLSSIIIMIYFVFKNFVLLNAIFIGISSVVSIFVIWKLYKDIDDYKAFKKKYIEYKLF